MALLLFHAALENPGRLSQIPNGPLQWESSACTTGRQEAKGRGHVLLEKKQERKGKRGDRRRERSEESEIM